MKNKSRVLQEFDDIMISTNLDDLRQNLLMDKKIKVALIETLLCILFVVMTMAVSYQMLDNDSFGYRNNLMNLFGAGSVSNSFNSVNAFF
jgi:hypothetical protein